MPLSDHSGKNNFNLNNKSFTNRGASGGTPIYDITSSGGVGSGGNQILAQGRVYDIDSYASFAFDQIGFSGSPLLSSSGAPGYNSSEAYCYWNFPGININDHIIKVSRTKHKMKSTGSLSAASDTYLEWRISGSNIIVVWDLYQYNFHHPDMMNHYISVESSPF